MSASKPLPDHIASTEEWKAWPRKAEAHVRWGVRERQVTAKCRTGALDVWACPDSSLRIEPEQLTELYGPEGIVQGRDRDASLVEQAARRRAPPVDTSDPLVSMFREVVSMLREARQEKSELIKLIVDPMNAILGAFQSMLAESRSRVKDLESGYFEVMDMRAELGDAKHERALQVESQKAREKRRDETLSMVKPFLPQIVAALGSVNDLKSFVSQCPPEMISTVLDSQMLPPHLQEQLKRAQQATTKTMNGVSHG